MTFTFKSWEYPQDYETASVGALRYRLRKAQRYQAMIKLGVEIYWASKIEGKIGDLGFIVVRCEKELAARGLKIRNS